jgi:folate-binding protein YgfZ
VVEISGPDAADYLQRMTTANFKSLEVGGQTEGAFLTGKGTVILFGTFHRLEPTRFLFVLSPGQLQRALEHIEQFHFQEKLEIVDRSAIYALFGLWSAPDCLKKNGWQDFVRRELFFVLVPKEESESLLESWKKVGLIELGMPLFHYFRILSGLPWVGWEVGEGDLVLEAGLEHAVARNKGCYPGQEVVERIFTYGQVNRRLHRVELNLEEGSSIGQGPLEWKKGDALVGQLVSSFPTPEEPGKRVGLAYIRKAFWENQEEFRLCEGVMIRNV